VSATAQPITEIRLGDHDVVFLAASEGIDAEIQIDGVRLPVVRGASTAVTDEGRHVIRPHSAPGIDCRVQVGRTTFVILDSGTADAVWRGPVNGIDSVVIWPHGGWFDDGGFVAERQEADEELLVLTDRGDGSGVEFRRRIVEGTGARHDLEPPVFPAAPVFAPRVGGPASRFAAPTEDDFVDAAMAEIRIPSGIGDGADQVVLRLDWVGDVIRLHIGEDLIADQFWSGRPLEIDLSGHRDLLTEHPIRLTAFAWDPATRVHVDPRVRPRADDPVLRVDAATLLVRRYARVS
jgi:hypothetical protein